MCVDGLELIYTFNIMSCNVFQAGKWLNANISCYLMGHQICCFTMKYDPLHLQIFTTHCILSLICLVRYISLNLERSRATLELPTFSLMSEENGCCVNMVY